ncbi:MFS transporter [Paractinoplanes atraurantiacus]|uniref:MFS transporter n=1 Tax=Paractinoplanes atraurantiacus TaxID=1036182 RepID=UPI0015CF379A|nr:MFS transporter [Actinoplanes atraurantiacus]
MTALSHKVAPAPTTALCLAAAFTTLLDQSSLNTAVPALRDSLGAGAGSVQWIIAGYSLTFGLALVPAGRLGDAHGRKWLFIGGITLFCLAAILAGTAQEAWVVAVARLLQGVGAGTVNPQVLGIFQEMFTGRERTRALGAYALVGGIAGVIGPLVGGVLIDTAGWRYVLLLNVPFGLITIPLAIRYFPQSAGINRTTLDLPGLTLLGAATLSVLLPFTVPGTGWLLATTPALIAGLIIWERRYRGTPILLPALIRERGFRNGTLIAMFQFGSSLASSLAITLYLQEGLGWSPLHAALTVLPSALGFAVFSAVGWRILGRYGRRSVQWALVVAFVTIVATALIVQFVPEAHLGLALAVTQLVNGAAGGVIISPNQALTLAYAPLEAAGLAAALLQQAQRVAATIGTAAVTGVVLASLGRDSLTYGLAICAAMLAAAVFVAARPVGPAPALPARAPLDRPAARPR